MTPTVLTSAVLGWAITLAQILLVLAMACAAFRMLRGPRAQDRILGLDTLYVNAMLLLLTFGIRTGSTVYFEVALSSPCWGSSRLSRRQSSSCAGGDRMSDVPELPAWAALATAFSVLGGAGLTLIGCLGLLRLDNFYRRVHAPTLGTTLGAGGILIGSMICFSVLETRPVLHEILIALFVTVTTPVTLILLIRATLNRDPSLQSRRAGAAAQGPFRAGTNGPAATGYLLSMIGPPSHECLDCDRPER